MLDGLGWVSSCQHDISGSADRCQRRAVRKPKQTAGDRHAVVTHRHAGTGPTATTTPSRNPSEGVNSGRQRACARHIECTKPASDLVRPEGFEPPTLRSEV